MEDSTATIPYSILDRDFYVLLAALTKAFSAVEYGLIISDEIALQLHLISSYLKRFGLTSIEQVDFNRDLFSAPSFSCLTASYGNTAANCLTSVEAPGYFRLGDDLYEVRFADFNAHKPRFRLIKNGTEIGNTEARIDYSNDSRLVESASTLELTRENLAIHCLVASPEYIIALALLNDKYELIRRAKPIIDELERDGRFKYYRLASILGEKNREKFVRFLARGIRV
ncbi:hypothetical protein J4450_00190 [Candidatus Micrarchaeota archaeon]|nr:hypothetical protein [Candidatus Micrarchaeota archaeon]